MKQSKIKTQLNRYIVLPTHRYVIQKYLSKELTNHCFLVNFLFDLLVPKHHLMIYYINLQFEYSDKFFSPVQQF